MGKALVRALVVLVGLGSVYTQAQASTVFFDDFDSENGGTSASNYTGFANFTLFLGNVDLVRSGDGGVTCVGGLGSCVDLAGRTAGLLQSASSFAFNAGDTIQLSIDLSGNQRGGPVDANSLGFSFASGVDALNRVFRWEGGESFQGDLFGTSFFSASRSITAAVPFGQRSYSFTAGNAGVLRFSIGGGGADDLGPILDNVRLEITAAAVPEPASWALMIAGFGVMGGMMRRKPVLANGRALAPA